MGIQIDFNPDLALRDFSEFEKGNRKEEECIPKNLQIGEVYNFLKEGQRVYWLTNSEFWFKGEMPLMKTEGNQKLSRPIASIRMLEVTHFLIGDKPYTKGKFQVMAIFDSSNPKINFESYRRIK